MTRSAKVRVFFGDADHDFALLIGQCVELQELTGAGLGVTLTRIETLCVTDIRQVLRLGLIGGGMAKEMAFRHVERHVVAGEIGVCAEIAYKVCAAAIAGAPEEVVGESKGGEESLTSDLRSPTDSSDTPISMEAPPPSESHPLTSTSAASGSSEPQSTGGKKPTRPKTTSPLRRVMNMTKSSDA